MHKIKIIDINSENERQKDIEIEDSLFEIAIRKGLIEKNEDGYYFIGDYEELLAYQIKKSIKKFYLLEWTISREGARLLFDSPLLVSRPPLLPP